MIGSSGKKALQQAIQDLGIQSEIQTARLIGGGCISEAWQVDLKNGTSVFAKMNSSERLDMFQAEASGLEVLRRTNTIRVPDVLSEPSAIGAHAILILELISAGKPSPFSEEKFARKLAELHRWKVADHNIVDDRENNRAESPQFGYSHDNFIGSTAQINGWSASWIEFFRERRLLFQAKLALRKGVGDAELYRNCDRLADRLDDLLLEPEHSSLVHGDLWSGNFLTDINGAPALIDPAVYFADREAEFGMLTLFGGLGPHFYDAYLEAYPLPDGYSERFEIYKLYHVLNHLNLFGQSYLEQCKSILRKFV